MINFLSTNIEKPCQFALRHSNLSLALTNNTHTIAPLKKATLDGFSCVVVGLLSLYLSLVVLLMMLCFHIHTSFIDYLLSFCDARKLIFLSLRFRYSEMNIREKPKKNVSIIATSSYDTFLLYPS